VFLQANFSLGARILILIPIDLVVFWTEHFLNSIWIWKGRRFGKGLAYGAGTN
jgi:hypothetical protein